MQNYVLFQIKTVFFVWRFLAFRGGVQAISCKKEEESNVNLFLKKVKNSDTHAIFLGKINEEQIVFL